MKKIGFAFTNTVGSWKNQTTIIEKEKSETETQIDRVDSAFNRRFLFKCAMEEDHEMVAEMVANGVTPNFSNAVGKTALLVSVERKDVNLVNTLLNSPKILVNMVDTQTGATPLITACKEMESKSQADSKYIIKLLLQKSGIDLNIVDKSGETALSYAVKSRDLQLVRTLVDAHADINLGSLVDGKPVNPLYYAKSCGYSDIVFFLESKGGKDPGSIKSTGHTNIQTLKKEPTRVTLSYASDDDWSDWSVADSDKSDKDSADSSGEAKNEEQEDDNDENEDAGSDDDIEESPQNQSRKNEPQVQEQVPSVATVPVSRTAFSSLGERDLPSNLRKRAIAHGSMGKPGSARFLKYNTTDTPKDQNNNINNQNSDEPKRVRVKSRSLPPLPDPEPPWREQENPTPPVVLHCSDEETKNLPYGVGDTPPFTDPILILPPNSTPDDNNSEYKQKLMWVLVSKKDYYGVAELIKQGVSPNYKNSGMSCLLYSLVHVDTKMFRLLLKSPLVDINTYDLTGTTPLIAAAKIMDDTVRTEFLELLLSTEGININAGDNRGRTALVFATAFGHWNFAKMLLNAGADVNLGEKTAEGLVRNPLYYAVLRKQKNMIDLIKLHGGNYQPRESKKLTPQSVQKKDTLNDLQDTQTPVLLIQSSTIAHSSDSPVSMRDRVRQVRRRSGGLITASNQEGHSLQKHNTAPRQRPPPKPQQQPIENNNNNNNNVPIGGWGNTVPGRAIMNSSSSSTAPNSPRQLPISPRNPTQRAQIVVSSSRSGTPRHIEGTNCVSSSLKAAPVSPLSSNTHRSPSPSRHPLGTSSNGPISPVVSPLTSPSPLRSHSPRGQSPSRPLPLGTGSVGPTKVSPLSSPSPLRSHSPPVGSPVGSPVNRLISIPISTTTSPKPSTNWKTDNNKDTPRDDNNSEYPRSPRWGRVYSERVDTENGKNTNL